MTKQSQHAESDLRIWDAALPILDRLPGNDRPLQAPEIRSFLEQKPEEKYNPEEDEDDGEGTTVPRKD
jgi:hypothetical protein